MISRRRSKEEFPPTDTSEGYQRAPVTARVRKAARYYDEKKGRMPNPLLVNIHKIDMDEERVVVVDGDQAGWSGSPMPSRRKRLATRSSSLPKAVAALMHSSRGVPSR